MTATILNVDDNAPSLYATSRILRHAGYDVREADTAADAWRVLRELVPDVVLLDVNLPDGNGFDICAAIRRDEQLQHVPVLMLSATSISYTDRASGLDAGADGYLIEPIEREELVAAVGSLLRMRSAEAEVRRLNRMLEQKVKQLEATQDALLTSETRLRRLVEANIIGVLQADSEGNILEANDAFLEIVGYTREEFEAGEVNWRRLTPAEYLSADERSMAESEIHGSCTPYEKMYRRRDGVLVPVLIGHATLPQREHAYIAFILNLTAQKAAEERERAARETAEEANRSKDRFLATLSHELRTPMTSIMGWASMLRLGLTDSSTTDLAIRSLCDAAQLQARLIDDLLDVTRAASGKLEVERTAVDLVHVVEETVEAQMPAAEERGVSVEFHRHERPAVVSGDHRRLRQITSNLLSNAIKFTPQGGRVEVAVEDAEHRVILRVRDSGKGISREFLPHVFDAFSQQDVGSTREHGGLGLGLAIVRDLVAVHDGTVEASSEGEGRGAEFRVTLPALNAGV